MPQSYAALNVHLIFSTKNRLPQIDAELQPPFSSISAEFAGQSTRHFSPAGGNAGSRHLLVSLAKSVRSPTLCGRVKTNSSKWVHESFPTQASFAWQAGYGAFSVSHSGIDKVKRYVANQAEHHLREDLPRRVFGVPPAPMTCPMTNAIYGITPKQKRLWTPQPPHRQPR